MRLAQVVLALFAPLMLVGGVAGWRSARSKASLIAGTASAVVLAGALAISLSEPVQGFWLGAMTSLALCVVFALRWSKTAKFMPSGLLLLVSAFVLLVVTRAALEAQGKL